MLWCWSPSICQQLRCREWVEEVSIVFLINNFHSTEMMSWRKIIYVFFLKENWDESRKTRVFRKQRNTTQLLKGAFLWNTDCERGVQLTITFKTAQIESVWILSVTDNHRRTETLVSLQDRGNTTRLWNYRSGFHSWPGHLKKKCIFLLKLIFPINVWLFFSPVKMALDLVLLAVS